MIIKTIPLITLLILSSYATYAAPSTEYSVYVTFVKCLRNYVHSPNSIVFDKTNTSYTSILRAYIRNARFNTTKTPKPLIIVTPLQQLHVQATIICAQKIGIQVKIRSGGHDFEGLSYISDEPFIILDMFNLRNISVDVQKGVAVVQSGATLGEFYHRIWEKSGVHGFPAGVCPTVGVGGHFTGGGYGNMIRKFGLSIDHIIDAEIVDAKGRVLNRESMGEDLFWAIRGGGGASFGVILSYKVKLVSVPRIVTVFLIERTLEQNGTDLVVQWQKVAPHTDNRLFMRLHLSPENSSVAVRKRTIRASVTALFLGRSNELVSILGKEFPILGLKIENCSEMSWIESVLWYASFPNGTDPNALFDRKLDHANFLKRKSDYVKTPISRDGLGLIWEKMMELGQTALVFNPYGGRMNEVSENATAFPHRAGNLFKIEYSVNWHEAGDSAEKSFVTQIRRLHSYMTPFVSKNPRSAFLNYRDNDIGINHHDGNSYKEGKVYGVKYFNKNFYRLVKIKNKVDPHNFFRYEQSIPTIPPKNKTI